MDSVNRKSEATPPNPPFLRGGRRETAARPVGGAERSIPPLSKGGAGGVGWHCADAPNCKSIIHNDIERIRMRQQPEDETGWRA